jgi:hypothetical protein
MQKRYCELRFLTDVYATWILTLFLDCNIKELTNCVEYVTAKITGCSMNIEHCPFNAGIHADEERKENGQYIIRLSKRWTKVPVG